jgi:hypothetical protein
LASKLEPARKLKHEVTVFLTIANSRCNLSGKIIISSVMINGDLRNEKNFRQAKTTIITVRNDN